MTKLLMVCLPFLKRKPTSTGKQIRISLGLDEFEALINGEELKLDENGVDVRMILKDIGFHIMEDRIKKARYFQLEKGLQDG